jgi:Putative DNA-binding domain
VVTPAAIQHGPRRFEPGALPPISGRTATRQPAYSAFAASVASSPVEILVARFPVIRRLVGNESFRVMARRFVAGDPPRSSDLLHYGDAFPRFLRSLGRAASIEYVADIAELEMTRGRAYCAAEALPVDAQAVFSAWTQERGDLRVLLHPSVFVVTSRFPIVTIWHNNQLDGEPAMLDRWRAESALVARPYLDVEVQCLPNGGHAFIGALAAGHTIATAVEAGKMVTPDFDIACNLAFLAEAGIVVGLRNKEAVS